MRERESDRERQTERQTERERERDKERERGRVCVRVCACLWVYLGVFQPSPTSKLPESKKPLNTFCKDKTPKSQFELT